MRIKDKSVVLDEQLSVLDELGLLCVGLDVLDAGRSACADNEREAATSDDSCCRSIAQLEVSLAGSVSERAFSLTCSIIPMVFNPLYVYVSHGWDFSTVRFPQIPARQAFLNKSTRQPHHAVP